MKRLLFFLLGISAMSFALKSETDKAELDKMINDWHLAAAKADFKKYFEPVTEDFIYLGTDPTERWTRKQFESFCKPYFDEGKAWDFKATERNWVFAESGEVAWFDEKLTTWMEDCRGSGVVVKQKGKWKLAYYNLTVVIENDKINQFIDLRKK